MGDVIRSEWLKVRSVRSTAWAAIAVFVLGVGLSQVVGRSFRDGFADRSAESQESFDPVWATFYSLTLAQLALVVLAVLMVGNEYATGTIRTSLTAAPRRAVFYGGKVLTGSIVAATVSVATVLATFVSAQAALGPLSTSFGADGVAATAVGACAGLTLISVFAMGVTTMLRSAKGALIVLLPILFLGSQGIGNLPQLRSVVQYLPDQAGMVMMGVVVDGDPQFGRDYGAWAATGILASWAVAALAGGYVMLRRRDV